MSGEESVQEPPPNDEIPIEPGVEPVLISPWDQKYEELRAYKDQKGRCEVPQKYKPNPSLGYWVNKQRSERKKYHNNQVTTLTAARISRLNAIGFRWEVRRPNKSWEEYYNELEEFKAAKGHCHVPTKYEGNKALGRWVSKQRSLYKRHGRRPGGVLSEGRIKQLENLGFAWSLST